MHYVRIQLTDVQKAALTEGSGLLDVSFLEFPGANLQKIEGGYGLRIYLGGAQGTGPYGTGPEGTYPGGTGPFGTQPGGTGPGGTQPGGTGPSGTLPGGTGPSGTGPSGTGPSGTGPSGTLPGGTGPGGTLPGGTGPSGTGPSGTGPDGTPPPTPTPTATPTETPPTTGCCQPIHVQLDTSTGDACSDVDYGITISSQCNEDGLCVEDPPENLCTWARMEEPGLCPEGHYRYMLLYEDCIGFVPETGSGE